MLSSVIPVLLQMSDQYQQMKTSTLWQVSVGEWRWESEGVTE